jgi:hypothetical protein
MRMGESGREANERRDNRDDQLRYIQRGALPMGQYTERIYQPLSALPKCLVRRSGKIERKDK